MTYRVLCLEATSTAPNTLPGKGKAKRKPADKKTVGERAYFEGLRIDTVFNQFVEGVDPRSQAEAWAAAWVGEKSGRTAVVVADITQFTSVATVQSNHPKESARASAAIAWEV